MKLYYLVIFLTLQALSLHSLVIGLAELEIRGETLYNEEIELSLNEKNITTEIFNYLREKVLPDRLRFTRLNSLVHLQEPVTSTVRAEEAAYLSGLDYIVYGSVRKTANYYDGRFCLYSKTEQADIVTLYVKRELDSFDSFDSYVALVAERLLERLTDHFKVTLEKTGSKREFKLFDSLLIHNSLDYFLPFSPWWEVQTGIAGIESGIYFNLIPLKHFNQDVCLRLRFGQTTNYTISINKPDYITTIYNSLQFKFPFLLGVELFNRYLIFAEVAPAAGIDFIYRVESYMKDRVEGLPVFTLFLSTGFEYRFGKERKVALGVKTGFDLSFYRNFRGAFRPQIYLTNKIDFKRKRDKDNEEVNNTVNSNHMLELMRS